MTTTMLLNPANTALASQQPSPKRFFWTAALAAGLILGLATVAGAADLDDNPPGPLGGPGTNWENPPGPKGGPGASPDRIRVAHVGRYCHRHYQPRFGRVRYHCHPRTFLHPARYCHKHFQPRFGYRRYHCHPLGHRHAAIVVPPAVVVGPKVVVGPRVVVRPRRVVVKPVVVAPIRAVRRAHRRWHRRH